MNPSLRTIVATLALLSAILPGCSKLSPPPSGYGVVVVNMSQNTIDNVSVALGGTQVVQTSSIAKGSSETVYPNLQPLPDEATLQWVVSPVHYGRQVRLSSLPPASADKTNIYLIIHDGIDVSVQYASRDDQAATEQAMAGTQ